MKRIYKPMFFHSNMRMSALFWIAICILWMFVVPSFRALKPASSITSADSLWLGFQKIYDSLAHLRLEQRKKKYPFNPNYLTPYRAYQWGMTEEQLQRLQKFRENGKFVNSHVQFQEVTQVSDSLLKEMSPYFKFPEWVTKGGSSWTEPIVPIKDINQANLEDFTAISGIGQVLGNRILDYRSRLGAFVNLEQLNEVYGLNDQVISQIHKRFRVGKNVRLNKINVNEASYKELQQFPYFGSGIAREIVTIRSMNGEIKNIDDLTKIINFPADKIKIIALYLEFKKIE